MREQGVNGQNEMAAAFMLAGFDAIDVHMQDLIDDPSLLSKFQGFGSMWWFLLRRCPGSRRWLVFKH